MEKAQGVRACMGAHKRYIDGAPHPEGFSDCSSLQAGPLWLALETASSVRA